MPVKKTCRSVKLINEICDCAFQHAQMSITILGVVPSLKTEVVNRAGLRIWNLLAERLTQLVIVHNRVTELPTTSTGKDAYAPLMSVATMLSFLLAPLFMAGSSVNGQSILSVSYTAAFIYASLKIVILLPINASR